MSGQVTNKPKFEGAPAIGPILGASVVTPSIDAVLALYRECGFRLVSAAPSWGRLPELLQQACTRRLWLGGDSGRPWLQLVEIPGSSSVDRYRHCGWFSLEVGSNDVEALATRIHRSAGFDVLAGPAPLDVSDDIIAMQVIGPAGELYYFTQVKRPLPPFLLPMPKHRLDELFIAVVTTSDRAAAVDFWQSLTLSPAMSFETRIGVLNRGLGLDETHRLPVAIAQLGGANLIEMDEIPDPGPRPVFSTGIAMISIAAGDSQHIQGAAGEWLELVAETAAPIPQPHR